MNLDYEQNRLLATGATPEPAQEPAKPRRKRKTPPSIKEALAPYFDAQTFNRLIGAGETAELALSKALRSGDPPPEARAMFAALLDLLRPDEGRTQIRSPSDVAALLMAEMSHLDHEQLRVIALDTKNRILAMSILYCHMAPSINATVRRVIEQTFAEDKLLDLPSEAFIVADDASGNYLAILVGLEDGMLEYVPLVHLCVRDDQVIVVHNGTDTPIEQLLIKAGVPDDRIADYVGPPEPARPHETTAKS